MYATYRCTAGPASADRRPTGPDRGAVRAGQGFGGCRMVSSQSSVNLRYGATLRSFSQVSSISRSGLD